MHHRGVRSESYPFWLLLEVSSILVRPRSAGVGELFTHSKAYTASHQRLMLLKKTSTLKKHGLETYQKNVSKIVENKTICLEVILKLNCH